MQVKENKYRIFWGITDVQTDDHFDPDNVDKVNRQIYKHH